jgi:shikimate kinase
MATGKTSVGRALAGLTGRPFLDLDAAIEARSGATIVELFARGEAVFRAREREVLRQVAAESRSHGTVVSTGGGAVVDPENLAVLRESGHVVLLEATLDEIDGRLAAEAARGRLRPLWAGDDGGADPAARRQRLGGLLQARQDAYRAVAASGLRLASAGASAETLAEAIVRWLERGAPPGAER